MAENNNTAITAQVQALGDLVAYQEHSVVSREIIHKSSGTMTVFAFDKGEGLSEHTAPFDAAVYLIEGEAEVFIDSHPYVVKSGQMIILPAGRPHALKALTPFKMLLVMIR
ncbi:MAG TPA: cupin domain-containing protein [Syntrophorhabdaceae bacterium]|nr:cupin domain-containing protein [Syntrophorhabdaceae bacterium]